MMLGYIHSFKTKIEQLRNHILEEPRLAQAAVSDESQRLQAKSAAVGSPRQALRRWKSPASQTVASPAYMD